MVNYIESIIISHSNSWRSENCPAEWTPSIQNKRKPRFTICSSQPIIYHTHINYDFLGLESVLTCLYCTLLLAFTFVVPQILCHFLWRAYTEWGYQKKKKKERGIVKEDGRQTIKSQRNELFWSYLVSHKPVQWRAVMKKTEKNPLIGYSKDRNTLQTICVLQLQSGWIASALVYLFSLLKITLAAESWQHQYL